MVKIEFEGIVTRIYDETRGQYTSKYVVVSDGAEKYPNTLRFKMRRPDALIFREGAKVKVEAYLDGREWTNKDGVTMYFTDLNVNKIEVLGYTAAPDAAEQPKPTTAADWQSLCALGQAYGEDTAAVTNYCKATFPGKASNTYTAADWQAVANAIVRHHTPAPAPAEPSEFSDDMPF